MIYSISNTFHTDTLIALEIKVLGLKNNYSLKQILFRLSFFLDKTVVDMHAAFFLCLLLLPFSHRVGVILLVLTDSMLFFEKNVLLLKKKIFVVSIKINSTFLFGMKVYWHKNRMGEFQLLNFRPIFLYAF